MTGEAIDTVLTLGWALAAWIVLVSLAAALALHTAIAIVWWAGRGAWRTLRAAWPRRGAPRGPGAPETVSRDSSAAGHAPKPAERRSGPSRRPVPSWAHTEPYTHEEAA